MLPFLGEFLKKINRGGTWPGQIELEKERLISRNGMLLQQLN
jgi:hypothetical protein